MNNPLCTTAQLDEFRQKGFLVLPNVFSAAEVTQMRREADFVMALIVNSSSCVQSAP